MMRESFCYVVKWCDKMFTKYTKIYEIKIIEQRSKIAKNSENGNGMGNYNTVLFSI